MAENNVMYIVSFRIDHFHTTLFHRTINELEINLLNFKYLSSKVTLYTRNKEILNKKYSEYDGNEATTYSSVVVKNRQGIVMCSIYNDAFMPFNFEEIFRMLHAIHVVEQKGELCPANWYPNKPTIRANITNTIHYLLNEL